MYHDALSVSLELTVAGGSVSLPSDRRTRIALKPARTAAAMAAAPPASTQSSRCSGVRLRSADTGRIWISNIERTTVLATTARDMVVRRPLITAVIAALDSVR